MILYETISDYKVPGLRPDRIAERSPEDMMGWHGGVEGQEYSPDKSCILKAGVARHRNRGSNKVKEKQEKERGNDGVE